MIADSVAILGLAALVTGCYLAWAPLGWIVAGLVLLMTAAEMAKAKKS